MADKSNFAIEKEAALEHVTAIGKTEGAGAIARVTLAEYVCVQAKADVFVPEDAEEVWQRMSLASNEAQDEAIGGSEQTFRQRTSDIRHFILLGRNPDIDGVAALREFKVRMVAIRKDRQGPKGRVWPMMLKFAMTQAPLKVTMQPKAMDKLCDLPLPPKRKTVEKFWSIRELLNKANEGTEDKRIQAAIDLIDETVVALGGTPRQKKAAKEADKKAKKAEQKAKAKAKKAAAKNGTTKKTPKKIKIDLEC